MVYHANIFVLVRLGWGTLNEEQTRSAIDAQEVVEYVVVP